VYQVPGVCVLHRRVALPLPEEVVVGVDDAVVDVLALDETTSIRARRPRPRAAVFLSAFGRSCDDDAAPTVRRRVRSALNRVISQQKREMWWRDFSPPQEGLEVEILQLPPAVLLLVPLPVPSLLPPWRRS
jgi:hypothetical protein